ncbi:hypothetical protein T439DRAFT_43461 [Meredithblackwellia eburnea MCA 4105]
MRFSLLSVVLTTALLTAPLTSARPDSQRRSVSQSSTIVTFDTLTAQLDSSGIAINNSLKGLDTANSTLVTEAVEPILTQITDNLSAAVDFLRSDTQKFKRQTFNVDATASSVFRTVSALVVAVEPVHELGIPSLQDPLNVIMLVLYSLLATLGVWLLDILKEVGKLLSGSGIGDRLKRIVGSSDEAEWLFNMTSFIIEDVIRTRYASS